MNEDISSNDDGAIGDEPIIESGELQILKEKLACATVVPAGCDTDELNPKNYAYLPSCWTNKIRPAGRPTPQVKSMQGILC